MPEHCLGALPAAKLQNPCCNIPSLNGSMVVTHRPRMLPTKLGIDVCHSLAQCQVDEPPAEAEVGEDDKQLPQHGVEPEQSLRKTSEAVSLEAEATCPHMSR